MKLVVFDLAGTTVRDNGQVPEAFAAALNEHGIEATAQQVNAVRGASKKEAVVHFIPEGLERLQRADKVYAAFRERLSQRYKTEGVEAIDDAGELFEEFRARGIRVALNTGFDRHITSLLLTQLGWEAKVDAVICGDDVPEGRPAPFLIFRAMEATGIVNVRDVTNVGDTVADLQAGFNASVGWNIGVLSGAHTRAQLEEHPHTHLLNSIADLYPLFLE